MAEINPYEPPQINVEVALPGEPSPACPRCGNTQATRVRFTWWGGALAPKLFSVVKCTQCLKRFNGKTGKSLTRAIVITFVLLLVSGYLVQDGLLRLLTGRL